ncbi:hypothetical protein E4U13_001236 [Claviceps humidiphila]|uniref:Piwi domain-containing protein n=1 Tax=Claviceps humidiphila TaxID=1294629 RepID=A0A9P7Q5Z8_9HYPO|nr:hypothetical protein E4U13_001236 [Claviceps humidiphila]
MTMAVDRYALRHTAAVQSNGYRVEMLTKTNVRTMFGTLFDEDQFAHVIDQEICHIKDYVDEDTPTLPMPQPKFTVIVATKRHHIRFFPEEGEADSNGNPVPGTLVERDVTHPFIWDFYLSSHVAIQGTARPAHYYVILDEMEVPVNDLQNMIYQQCYSYARSTTPVSLHPAVYYAHLAAARARAHVDIDASLRGIEAPPLLPLGGTLGGNNPPGDGEKRQRDFIRSTMWYI